MITWNDFILDDFLGPVLKLENRPICTRSSGANQSFTEETRELSTHQDLGRESGHKDAGSTKQNQETGRMQRLARMVGHTSSAVESHMEVSSDGSHKVSSVIKRGEA